VSSHGECRGTAEGTRRESEELFRAICTAAQDAIFMIDHEARISFCNDAAGRIFGYAPQEMMGKNVHRLLAPARLQERAEKGFRRFQVIGEDAYLDNKIRRRVAVRKDGAEFPIEISVAGVKIKGRWHAVGIGRDITKRVRTAETLQKRTHDLRERVKKLNCLFGVSRLVEGHGTSLEKILRGIVDLVPPSWQYPEITCAQIVLEDRMFQTDNFGETAWGQASDIVVRGERVGVLKVYYLEERPDIYEGPFLNEERNLIDVIAERIGRIIERKRYEERLLVVSRAVDQSPSSVVITDAQGLIEYVNPKFTELTGYTAEKTIGKKPGVMKSGVHSPEFYKEMWDTLLTGEEWRGELCNRKKNGELYWEQASISPVRNAEGETTHFVAVKEDITDKRRAEQELRRYAEEQEKLSKIITEQNAQLTAANEKLRSLDQQKSEFLNMVAHDLRTPLTSIRSYADLLLMYKDEPAETREEFLTIISKESKRLGNLINDFLDLARIEAGTIRFAKESVSIEELIAHFISVYEGEAKHNNIALDVRAESELPNVFGDRERIGQVLSNILSNAVKFTPEGGSISVTAKRAVALTEEMERTAIEICVADTGPGIDPKHHEAIFDKFGQVKDRDSRDSGGTGLGLAIAREIVERHGGRIWVESELGHGARFLFTLLVEGEG